MAGRRATKSKLLAAFSGRILAQSEECTRSDFAAMDGGAFFIGAANRNVLIEFLAQKQASGDYKIGLVPTLADKTIYFADIDELPSNFDFRLFLALLVDEFNRLVTDKVKPVTIKDVLILKREDSARYHVYIPCLFGEVSKAVREKISKAVNISYAKPVIDLAANTIRIEGFEKWDRDAKQFIAGSRYLPTGGAAQNLTIIKLLNEVWLNPRGWDEQDATVVAGCKHKAVVGGNKDQDSDGNADLVFDNGEEKAESEIPSSKEASLDIVHKVISDEIEARIKSKFPAIAHVLLKYPITDLRIVKKGRAGHSTFMLDKSEQGRTCRIAKRVHKSSNTYLWYHHGKQALYQKCYSSGCTNKDPVLLHRIKVDRKVVEKKHDLPSANDASVAEHFIKWNPLLAVERRNKKYVWFIYNEEVGYWKTSPQAIVMRMIQIDFREWIQDRFDEAIGKAEGEEEQLMNDAEAVDSMLRSVRCVKAIAESVRWQLAKPNKIEWNSISSYTVFPNGVLQVDKRDKANPELYYFGKTKPEEYINDSKCMKLPFNCPPVCNDGHYIQQAEALLRDWVLKIQPVAEDRRLLFTYLALVFKAINYKKMILNIGHSGDNAKSSFFEMGVYSFGSYGLKGDKALIVKSKKDRVSKAELNEVRFVLFEEPDAAKSLDIEFVKDLVGGAVETTGRFNFSNDNNVQLHCKTVLNANTMTTVQLEEAIMNRLLYLAWTAQFVAEDYLVDEEQRIYKADEKYKTGPYWRSMNDGFIWLLLNHYRLFELNGNKLKISSRQVRRTKAELLENDLFIRWFKENFVYLADTPENRTKFVTQDEVTAEFKKLKPAQQQQIIGRPNYAAAKYVKDMLPAHSAFKPCYKDKVTNWRLTAIERLLPAAKNKTGPNCQYQRHVLIRFVSRAEYESGAALETADLAALPADEAGRNYYDADEEGQFGDEKVEDDYLYGDDMFFKYMKPAVQQVNDTHDVAGIEEQARALSMEIDDAALVNGNNVANDHSLNENDDDRRYRRDSLMSYSAVGAINDEFMGNLLNDGDVMMADIGANDNLMNDNNDNRGGNGNLMRVDADTGADAGANGNLMNDNNDNTGGNDNLMMVDVCSADTDDRADAGAVSDSTNDQDAGVKDQADKPKAGKRRSKRRKVKVTYKNSKYGGGCDQDGLARKKRKM